MRMTLVAIIAGLIATQARAETKKKSFFVFSRLPRIHALIIDGRDYTRSLQKTSTGGAIYLSTTPIAEGVRYTSSVRINALNDFGAVIGTFQTKVNYGAGETKYITYQDQRSEATGRVGYFKALVTIDTKIFINGALTVQEGEVRLFQSPPINEGQTYPILVKFDFRNRTGRRVQRTKRYVLRPGATVTVDDIESLADEIPLGDAR